MDYWGTHRTGLTGLIPKKLALPDSFMGRESMGRAGHSQLAAMAVEPSQIPLISLKMKI